jgi:hypothetical protein
VRRGKGVPHIQGYVVGVGAKWTVLAVLDDRIAVDGWSALRIREIQSVTIEPDVGCLETMVLRRRGEFPPSSPDIDLADSTAVLRSIPSDQIVGVSVRGQRAHYLVGYIQGIDGEKVHVLCVGRTPIMDFKLRKVRARNIDRVNVGGSYERAHLLAISLPATADQAENDRCADRPDRLTVTDGVRISRILEDASRCGAFVGIKRWMKGADLIEGFVVGIGHKWVAVSKLGMGIWLDGWTLVRLCDIRAVEFRGWNVQNSIEIAALSVGRQWPVPELAIDMGDALAATVRTVASHGGLLTVFREYDTPDVCWIGHPGSVDGQTLTFLPVDSQAEWGRRHRLFDVADISRIDFGGGYEAALATIAGAPPTTGH